VRTSNSGRVESRIEDPGTLPRGLRWVLPWLTLVLFVPGGVSAQDDEFRVEGADGSSTVAPVRIDRGFAAAPHDLLEELGWRLEISAEGLKATRDRNTFVLTPGSPFFRWNGELLQFVSAPYARDGIVWVPLQLFLDFFPERLEDTYRATDARTLVSGARAETVETGHRERAPDEDARDDTRPGSAASEARAPGSDTPHAGEAAESQEDPTRGLVVIDPGHGGRDPGAIGSGGRREKDIALAIGRALARELSDREGLEVRMTRDRDVLVPIWERGHMATEWKGDRPGVFLSIHVNSVPGRPAVRGFETYFLSEARTEHEARVAENENAPLALRGEETTEDEPGLDFILRELRNRDYQRWSSVLAEEIQLGIERVHPGPNRGVKQGPLAVITNALKPAALIEVGFVTNPREERLLSRGDFQRELAREIAGAVDRFFVRYPGSGVASGNRP